MKKPLQSKPAARKPPVRSAPAVGIKRARKAISAPANAKPPVNVSALAREHGISRETLRQWHQVEGLDLADESAIKARVSAMRSKAPTDLASAKLEKLNLESERLKLEIQIRRGDYVSAAEIQADGLRIASLTRSVFLRMENDLPPILAGLSTAEIKISVRKYVREKLTELSQYKSPISIQP